MSRFEPKILDFERSPYTGYTRETWVEAGKYILENMFRNLASPDSPVVMPRQDTEVTYPHLSDPPKRQEIQRKAEVFEGLARSFFFGSVLIHEEPELVLQGIPVRDYYRAQILHIVTPGDPLFAGFYEDNARISGSSDPFQAFQQTVETCGLVIGLMNCEEELWNRLSRAEQDRIAAFLSSYAHAPTVPQNWRMFNMLDLAFLELHGYPIDEEVLADHVQATLNDSAGDGWYRDGHAFDYYSCWAFNVYGPIFASWYGRRKMPSAAARYEAISNELMKSYPAMFGENAFVNMWGRSCIYRNAATSPLDANFVCGHPAADPGFARRICSGALKQFYEREDFLYEGVPTLGFYGQFKPLVQGYSCAESVYWMGKAFLCLTLPEDHPFWTARENNGFWEEMKEKELRETVLPGPGIVLSNHKANGGTILRSGKVLTNPSDLHGIRNYGKLCYHTDFPWEDAVHHPGTEADAIESQQYVIREYDGTLLHANAVFFAGVREGILYRRQIFDWKMTETHWKQAVSLADFPVPYGIFRADRLKLCRRPVEITLAGYGFPDQGTEIEKVCEEAAQSAENRRKPAGKALILRGKNAEGRRITQAFTVYGGFSDPEAVPSCGTNPDSPDSCVPYAVLKLEKQYGGAEESLMLTQTLTRMDGEDFTEEELFPLAAVETEDRFGVGSYGRVRLILKDGSVKTIDFDGMEGRLML